MKIYEEKSIKDFEFWAGAREFANRLNDDEWDILELYVTEMYPDGISNTDLNDLFWFDNETLLEVIGVSADEFWDR